MALREVPSHIGGPTPPTRETHLASRARRRAAGKCAMVPNILKGLGVLGIGVSLWGCEMGYLLTQGYHQATLLAHKRPVNEVLEDQGVDPGIKDRIRLIQAVCLFGEKELGLVRGTSYSSFVQIPGDAVVYVVSACPKDSLVPHTWWFPILGEFPYKGFFDPERAKKEKRALQEKDYDVHLGRASAFSALGWFSDPIYSSMLRMEETDLVYTIFHEMVHRTVFFKNQVDFNEQLATLVGWQATYRFMERSYGKGSPQARKVLETIEAQRAVASVLQELRAQLLALYCRDIPTEEKLSKRQEIFREAKRRTGILGKENPGARLDSICSMEWNNASFLALWRYRYDVGRLEELLSRLGGDLGKLIQRVRSWKDQGVEPEQALEKELGGQGPVSLLRSPQAPSTVCLSLAANQPSGFWKYSKVSLRETKWSCSMEASRAKNSFSRGSSTLAARSL